MHKSSLKDARKFKPDMPGAEGVLKQVPISKENGAPLFSFRVFTIEPGGHTPLHQHPFEHENYVIEGSGTAEVNGREVSVAKGDFVMVMPNEKHQYRNTSQKGDLVIICAVPKEYE